MLRFILIFTFSLMTSLTGVQAADINATPTGSKQCGDKYARGFELGVTNKCYTCPSGYKHAWWRNIKNKKSCYKKKPKKHTRAKYVGREGCKGRSNFEYVPTGQCYQCPHGTKRTNFVSNPAKKPVCKTKPPKASKSDIAKFNKAKKESKPELDFMKSMLSGSNPTPSRSSLRSQLNMDQGVPDVPGDYVTQTAGDRKRIAFMLKNVDNYHIHNDKYDTNYRAVSYTKSSGFAVGYGFVKEWGYSMEKNDDDTYSCIKIETKTHSGGLQLGADVGEGYAIHRYGINDVVGKAKGFTVAAAVFDATYTWTSPGGKFGLALAGPLMFVDGSAVGGFGIASLEAGAAYVHATTEKIGTTVPCNALVWGPGFDDVHSGSQVKP